MDNKAANGSAEGAGIKGEKKINKYVVIAILIISMLAAAGWFQFGNGSLPWKTGNSREEEAILFLFPLKEFQTNLADKGGRRYIRMKICFGSSDKSLGKEITEREPELRSGIIGVLHRTTVFDLDGDEGLALLKTRILKEVQNLKFKARVEDIFFDEFITQ